MDLPSDGRRRTQRGEVKSMRKILLAEDNPADVYLIREALREYGVNLPIRVASDGKLVMELIAGGESSFNAEEFALIILDLNLPLHDGTEILERLRVTDSLAGVPVVVLTSSDSPRDRVIARELGAACYLRKPSDLSQFLSLGAVFRDLLASSLPSPKADRSEGVPQ